MSDRRAPRVAAPRRKASPRAGGDICIRGCHPRPIFTNSASSARSCRFPEPRGIAAEREFKLLAENRFDEGFIASPAVAGDAIILRSRTHLYYVARGYRTANPHVSQKEIANEPKPVPQKKVAGKAQRKRIDLRELGAKLKASVKNGKMTEKEAMAEYQKALAKSKGLDRGE